MSIEDILSFIVPGYRFIVVSLIENPPHNNSTDWVPKYRMAEEYSRLLLHLKILFILMVQH